MVHGEYNIWPIWQHMTKLKTLQWFEMFVQLYRKMASTANLNVLDRRAHQIWNACSMQLKSKPLSFWKEKISFPGTQHCSIYERNLKHKQLYYYYFYFCLHIFVQKRNALKRDDHLWPKFCGGDSYAMMGSSARRREILDMDYYFLVLVLGI
jgi:hypothetical protein